LTSHDKGKEAALTTQINLARVALAEGNARLAPSQLRNLVQQADSQSSKYLSVISSVLLAEAMIKNKEYAPAQQELQRDLGRSEKLGLRLESARIHYLQATDLRLSGSNSEAVAQYREAQRLLDEIGKEPGAEHLSDRYDLKPIYSDIKQFAP
jgi:hypothetical protein